MLYLSASVVKRYIKCPLLFTARTQPDCCGDVAVCVCLTLMYCAKTTESIIMRPASDCSPAILVIAYRTK